MLIQNVGVTFHRKQQFVVGMKPHHIHLCPAFNRLEDSCVETLNQKNLPENIIFADLKWFLFLISLLHREKETELKCFTTGDGKT